MTSKYILEVHLKPCKWSITCCLCNEEWTSNLKQREAVVKFISYGWEYSPEGAICPECNSDEN